MNARMSAPFAEEAVLSALLIDPSLIPAVAAQLKPSQIHSRSLALMYAVMTAQSGAGRQVTPITVVDALIQEPSIEDARDLVGRVMDAVTTTSGVMEHVAIIQRAADVRGLDNAVDSMIGLVPEWARDIEAGIFHPENAVTRFGAMLTGIGRDAVRRSRFVDDVEIMNAVPVRPLVHGILPRGSLAEIHGPPGSAKSFAAIGLSLSIASGLPFLGHPVTRTGVVYVAPEGQAGIQQRVIAWKAEHNIADPSIALGVHFLPSTVNLLDAGAVAAFVIEAKQLPERPGLVVFDTLHRSMPGGDENSAKDIGLVIANMDTIRTSLDATVLLVHHTRKDGDAERGSTSIRGAMDTMIGIKRDSRRVTISCEKQKDAEEFSPIVAEMRSRDRSCVLITLTGAWEQSVLGLTESERKALHSLSHDFLSDGASATQWEKSSGVASSSFWRTLTALVNNGLATKNGAGRGARYTVTPKGAALVAPNSQVTPIHSLESDRTSLPPRGPFLERPRGESADLKEAS